MGITRSDLSSGMVTRRRILAIPNHATIMGQFLRLDNAVLFDILYFRLRTNKLEYIICEFTTVPLQRISEIVNMPDAVPLSLIQRVESSSGHLSGADKLLMREERRSVDAILEDDNVRAWDFAWSVCGLFDARGLGDVRRLLAGDEDETASGEGEDGGGRGGQGHEGREGEELHGCESREVWLPAFEQVFLHESDMAMWDMEKEKEMVMDRK